MDKIRLLEGEKPHKLLWTDPPNNPKAGELIGLRMIAKLKANGLVDCLLVYDYGERQSSRQALDFPPDQFELFFQGVQNRCTLAFHALDFSADPEEGMEIWEKIASGQ